MATLNKFNYWINKLVQKYIFKDFSKTEDIKKYSDVKISKDLDTIKTFLTKYSDISAIDNITDAEKKEMELVLVNDLRQLINIKQLYKDLLKTTFTDVSKNNTESKYFTEGVVDQKNIDELFNGGAKIQQQPKKQPSICKMLDTILYVENESDVNNFEFLICAGLVHYQCMKFQVSKEYKNQELTKEQQTQFNKYVSILKKIYENNKQIKTILSKHEVEMADDVPDDFDINNKMFNFLALKPYFKEKYNKEVTVTKYAAEAPKMPAIKQIKLSDIFNTSKTVQSMKTDMMLAERFTNSKDAFTKTDLSNIIAVASMQGDKFKSQLGGSQFGGSHLYQHILENLTKKLSDKKLKLSETDNTKLKSLISELEKNEKIITEALIKMREFTNAESVPFKNEIVSVDDIMTTVIKTKKESTDTEAELTSMIKKIYDIIKTKF